VKTVRITDETSALSQTAETKNGQRQIIKIKDDLEEVDYDELKDTAGVKTIRFEEDIRSVFCARNTSQFGYMAIVG
jgi:hypothetical protein